MAYLIFKGDIEEKQKFPLKEKGTTTIGRNTDNDIVVSSDVFISRYHSEITHDGQQYYLVNKTEKGTFVNGQKITGKCSLEDGDEIKLSDTAILIFCDTAPTTRLDTADSEILSLSMEMNVSSKKVKMIQQQLDALKSKTSGSSETDIAIQSQLKNIESALMELQEEVKRARKAREIMTTLYEVGKVINSVFELQELLNLIMDLAIKVMRAERGFIMLFDKDTGKLVPKVARNMQTEIDEMERVGISNTIAYKVANEGKPILTFDAISDDRFKTQQSVVAHQIRSVMCAPLIITKTREIIGAIYVDNLSQSGFFTNDDLEFLLAFANHSALAIENAKLYDNIRREERIRSNLQRYLSKDLVEYVLKNKGDLKLGGTQLNATMLFSDVRGFTTMVEKMTPVDTVHLLNEYFTLMTEEVFANDGTLDKYIGDAIMAVFGAPFPRDDDAIRAVRTAVGMRKKLEQLNKKWKSEGKSEIGVGIGINTGLVVAGNIGSEKRMEYTVISDAVNTAQRLESNAKKGQILISESTYNLVKNHFKINKLDPIKVKGKTEVVQVYEVLD